MRLSIKTENFGVAIFTLESSIDKHVLLVNDEGLMMRNLAGVATLGLDGLPLDWVVWIV